MSRLLATSLTPACLSFCFFFYIIFCWLCYFILFHLLLPLLPVFFSRSSSSSPSSFALDRCRLCRELFEVAVVWIGVGVWRLVCEEFVDWRGLSACGVENVDVAEKEGES